MPTPTYDLIQSSTVASPVTTINFNTILQSYKDLVLVVNARANTLAGGKLLLKLNNDSSSIYSEMSMFADSSNFGAYSKIDPQFVFSDKSYYTNTDSTIAVINFFDYSATDRSKGFIARLGSGGTQVFTASGKWASNTAITSISVSSNTGTSFAPGSTFDLYGIAA